MSTHSTPLFLLALRSRCADQCLLICQYKNKNSHYNSAEAEAPLTKPLNSKLTLTSISRFLTFIIKLKASQGELVNDSIPDLYSTIIKAIVHLKTWEKKEHFRPAESLHLKVTLLSSHGIIWNSLLYSMPVGVFYNNDCPVAQKQRILLLLVIILIIIS